MIDRPKLFTWDEITKDCEDQIDIVQYESIRNFTFTHNKEMNQCDMWVTNGVGHYSESLWQLVNIMPLNGMDWAEYKYSDLMDFARSIYMGIMRNDLPETFRFTV